MSAGAAGLSLAVAYRVQQEAVARRIAGGARVVGHKAGVTSPAMQQQMGVNEPDSGMLLDEMVLQSGSTIARSVLMQPWVEAEIAFRLGGDLAGPNVSQAEARAAVAEVYLALEEIDTRFASWRVTVAESIADNASCARAVIGPMVPLNADLNLATEALEVSVDVHAWPECTPSSAQPLATLVSSTAQHESWMPDHF